MFYFKVMLQLNVQERKLHTKLVGRNLRHSNKAFQVIFLLLPILLPLESKRGVGGVNQGGMEGRRHEEDENSVMEAHSCNLGILGAELKV